MNAGNDLENMEALKAHQPEAAFDEKVGSVGYHSGTDVGSESEFEIPTEEELHTLRRVSGQIPWSAYTIAFVELCERFSYYGTTAVFVNFIQQPLPPGSTTGAGKNTHQSGALGMGQRASTGLTTFNSFWAYMMPLLGAYMADTYWGRFKTIQVSCFISIIGHIILVISAIPPVVVHPNGAIAAFSIGIVIMGMGVGGFKSNISPLIAEQCTETVMTVKTTEDGERVIMDPAVTTSRVFLYFYMMINFGSLFGSIAMVYAEKYVGFYLAFLLPTFMLCLCPMIIFTCRKSYKLYPPTGSPYGKAFGIWNMAIKNRWSWNPVTFRKNVKAPGFWSDVYPSKITNKPVWMDFDDNWVNEVARGLSACKVFLWYPLYWLAYGQMTNNLTSQAAVMKLGGVPNDIVNNLNPIFIIILIPIMDKLVYPALRKANIHFTPIKRITCGFALASMAMISATVTQYYIYQMSPCGKEASTCKDDNDVVLYADISVWVQILPYGLIGFSEIMASITSLEYAYTKAPANMKSTVQAVCLFMNAFSSAIAQAFVYLAADPLLVWNYAVVAVLAAVGGALFWFDNRKLDAREDEMNLMPVSEHPGRGGVIKDEEQAAPSHALTKKELDKQIEREQHHHTELRRISETTAEN